MIRLLLILTLLVIPSCGAVEKADKKKIAHTIDVFVHRLGLIEVYCSISPNEGRCFAKTAAHAPVYFVCDGGDKHCKLHDVVEIPTGPENDQ